MQQYITMLNQMLNQTIEKVTYLFLFHYAIFVNKFVIFTENTNNFYKSLNLKEQVSEWGLLTLTSLEIYGNIVKTFLETYMIHLLVVSGFLLLLCLLIHQKRINSNMNRLLKKMEETESIDVFKMKSKLLRLEKENTTLIDNIIILKDNIEKYENIVDIYRKLRLNKVGYFILRGDNSDRTFRKRMRDIRAEYLAGGRYLVKLEYLNRFDNESVVL